MSRAARIPCVCWLCPFPLVSLLSPEKCPTDGNPELYMYGVACPGAMALLQLRQDRDMGRCILHWRPVLATGWVDMALWLREAVQCYCSIRALRGW